MAPIAILIAIRSHHVIILPIRRRVGPVKMTVHPIRGIMGTIVMTSRSVDMTIRPVWDRIRFIDMTVRDRRSHDSMRLQY